MKFRPVTLEIRLRGQKLQLLGWSCKNWHVWPNILESAGPICTKLSELIVVLQGSHTSTAVIHTNIQLDSVVWTSASRYCMAYQRTSSGRYYLCRMLLLVYLPGAMTTSLHW